MSLLALIVELILALIKTIGFATSAKQLRNEREAGAAIQRAEDLSREATRINKSARAGLGAEPDRLPDPFDRDTTP